MNIPHFKNVAAKINFYTHPINVLEIFSCHMQISDLCHFLGQANSKTSSFLKLGSQTKTMMRNIIFGNGGRFYPGLPIRIILTKVPCSRFFAKMFIFVFVPRNLIMSGVRPDSISRFFLEIIPQTSGNIYYFNPICLIENDTCS